MKAFHTIAVPHDDIMNRRLEMSVFAADLWDAFNQRGPVEYSDEKTFFKKTHITKNLEDILNGVQNRLQGKGGDGFLHIETPFGGGKTHAMIAMYHSAKKWMAKPVIIVGTSMGPEDTVWGMVEKQLDGKIDKLSGNLAPGREEMRKVLEKHGSVLILIDELLPYILTGSGVRIGDTTLATQTITFIQQLSETVSTLDRVCVVASLSASVVDMIDQKRSDELLAKLRKVSGRKERKIIPINQNDVPNIIRSRLFSTTNSEIVNGAEDTITKFVEYCERESILPPSETAVEYRKKFEKTYPFLPEVIETLYHKWGSFTSFQRTRGVLRLLSLVVYSMRGSERPYITLADFDLNDNEIRRELLENIGDNFDSVIAKDITDPASGAALVEKETAPSYRGMHIGLRASTAIFMYSFSSQGMNGATMNEIKRNVSDINSPSTIVGDVVGEFRSKLSYFKFNEDRYLFTSDPNLNRLKLNKMENIKDREVLDEERALLESNMGSARLLRPKIWPASNDVEDSTALKLVIMRHDNNTERDGISDNRGENMPRIYRNSIFFLCASDAERSEFTVHLKARMALETILSEITDGDQKKEIDGELRKEKSMLGTLIKKLYRTLYVPTRDGYDNFDMGAPTVGASGGISDHVLARLKEEQQVHESIGPLVLKNYIGSDKFAHTRPIYELMLKARGERRPTGRNVVEDAIKKGVRDGTFGIGEIVDGVPSCMAFKADPSVSFTENEVIIHESLCKPESQEDTPGDGENKPKGTGSMTDSGEPEGVGENKEPNDVKRELNLDFEIPEGNMNDVWGIMRLVNKKFKSIRLGISAKDGAMSENDIMQIRETLNQLGIDATKLD